MPPLVSVCIPTFNSSAFITSAIESILQQTLQDFEIVIVDNCSGDSTAQICNRFKNADSRISFIVNEFPLGIPGGLNRCLELATGTYVKFLMHDDLLQPTYLEKMVAVFDQFPTAKVVSCSQQNMAPDGRIVRQVTPYPESCLMPGRKAIKDMLLKMSNDIGSPSSVLMRRSDYGSGFNRSFYYFEDMELWLRVLRNGDYYFLNEPLSILRLHEDSGTTINCKTFIFISDILQLQKEFAAFMEEEGIPKEEWDQIIEQRIMSYIDYILLEEKLTVQEARSYVHRIKDMVGHDCIDQLLQSMVDLIFYGFSRMHELNIEARWNREDSQHLRKEMDLMTKTLAWRMAEPLRSFRSKLTGFGSRS